MKYNLMTFKDVDWSFVDHVEDADLRFKTVTVIMKNGNKFTVSLPKELFDGLWTAGENHVLDQDAKWHDDHFLGDGDLH